MYKLLLVDDEAEVREGMHYRIDWHAHGFEVIGEAENGRDALDLLERALPDVVVTDISMPILDGIGLASVLHERFPTIKVIFLTGYDEFEYVQQALRLEVQEYILKPVTAKSMGDILDRIKEKLDAEAAQLEDMRQLRTHYKRSLPILKDRFLTALTRRSTDEAIIRQRGHALGIDLDASAWMAVIISPDESTFIGTEFQQDDRELALFAICNVAEELLSRTLKGYVFTNDEVVMMLLCLNEINSEKAYSQVWSVLEAIRMSVSKHLRFHVSIGVSRLSYTLSGVPIAFSQALSALDYRMVYGTNHILYLEDQEHSVSNVPVYTEEQRHQLRLALKVGDTVGITAVLSDQLQPLMSLRGSLEAIQTYLLSILVPMMQIASELKISAQELFQIDDNWLKLLQLTTLQEVRQWFLDTAVRMGKRIVLQRQSNSEQLIVEACRIVDTQYMDPELSVSVVANALHISASYFSALFRKEKGETFLNYVIRIRMQMAKEFLIGTNMKTVEIAERVGYPDSHYFSYFFKKNQGVSPKEYRASIRTATGEM